jgi:MFS family permease
MKAERIEARGTAIGRPDMNKQDRGAWIIAISLFVSLFFLWGGGYNTMPVFVGALLKAFGWSHTRVSWIPCALMLAVGVTGPITGWLLDRFEARLVMGVGAALVVVGFIAASRATTFTELIIANLALGVGLGASGWLPASLVIANWFGERRGTALGLGLAGMESGGMAMTFMVGYIIARYSWRAAYLTLAVPVLIVALPLLVIVVRTRPRGVLKQTVAESAQAVPGYEVSKAIRTRVFWMLVVVQLAWGLSAGGVFIHIVAYLMGIGYTLRFATTVAGGVLGLFALGKPTMGALGDRIGGKNALGISLLLIAVSIISLLGARHEGLTILFMLLADSQWRHRLH